MKTIQEKIEFIRSGGHLGVFRPEEIKELQEKALDMKDVQLYDYLDRYWTQI